MHEMQRCVVGIWDPSKPRSMTWSKRRTEVSEQCKPTSQRSLFHLLLAKPHEKDVPLLTISGFTKALIENSMSFNLP